MTGSIVLCYHRVVPEPMATKDPFGMVTEVGRFRQQMEALARRWSIVPLHDLVGQLVSGSLRPGQAAVTFDDGYVDNYHHAFQVLQDLGIPATIFLVTGHIDRSIIPWWDRLAVRVKTATGCVLRLPHEPGDTDVDLGSAEGATRAYTTLRARLSAMDNSARDRILDALDDQPPRLRRYLSWQEVERMHRCGIAFGAHSHSHASLVATSEAVLREEILGSRDLIARHLGVSPSVFAYPYGDVDARAARAVEEAGFLGAVTIREAPCSSASSRYLLPRVCVANWDRDVFGGRLEEVGSSRMIHRVPRVYRSFRRAWRGETMRRRFDAACRRHKALNVLRRTYRSLRWAWNAGRRTLPLQDPDAQPDTDGHGS